MQVLLDSGKSRVSIGLALALLAACGPMDNGGNGGNGGGDGGGGSDAGGGMITPDWVSGTRLRARVQTSPDGAKAFYGWYDNQLHLDCIVQLAADGRQRCLPTSQLYAGVFFSDPACATQVGYTTTSNAVGCPPSLAMYYEPSTSCTDYGTTANKVHIYLADAVFTGTVYTRNGTSCIGYTDMTQYPYTSNTFYRLGAETPAATYAAVTITTE